MLSILDVWATGGRRGRSTIDVSVIKSSVGHPVDLEISPISSLGTTTDSTH